MPPARYRFDRCELHPASRRLLVDGRPVLLGGRAFDLLLALVERRGRVVGKDELLQAAWPGVVVEENNLAVQVSALRKLLGGALIATVAGRGYQFTGELQPLPDPGPAPAAGPAVPQPGTRLVGREAELATLDSLLRTQRLVTLAGPGGIGKTRLALAWCHGPGAGGRRAWADLAACHDAALLPALLLAAVGGSGGGPEALAQALAESPLTLVLDNVDALALPVAELVRPLLERAPGLRLLATSQVPLRLPQEQVLRLGALALPEGRVTPARALDHGAVALFVERVQAADPAFELAAGNLAAVLEICTRLDGLPLALELAAARVPALGVTALAGALDARLRMLGDPQRSAPARQRTLRAALAWSCSLLDAPARRLFAALGVFAGPFPLSAAQAVAGDGDGGWDMLAALGRLVEQSLLVCDGGDPPRYRLLESARLYAQELLAQDAEAPALRARHLAWCIAFVRATSDAAAIAAEYPHLRAALEQALVHDGGDREGGAALALGLQPYWEAGDDAGERQRWLGAAPPPAPAAASGDPLVARLVERLQAEGLGAATVDRETVIALARRLRPDEVRGVEGALAELTRAVEIARTVLAGGGDAEAATDAFVADVLAGVAEHTRSGELDRGVDALDDALAELDRREARRRAAGLRSRRALLEAGVQQDLLRRDAHAVARRIEALVALDAPQQPTQSAAYLAREAQALVEGREQGIALSVAVAIELARRRLAAAPDAAARRSASRVLASALVLRGARTADSSAYDEALQRVRQALQDGHPDDAERAELLLLASTVQARRGRVDGDPDRLRDGVARAREALRLSPRTAAPLAWAEAQQALGTALGALGALEPGPDALLDAVAALRASLQVITRRQHRMAWARTQAMLVNQLSVLAARESDPSPRLAQAATVQRQLLRALRRDREPAQWASAQVNLGIVLAAIGERAPGLEPLQQAVDAYRQSLRVWTREQHPAAWAAAQHNLGGALRLLGEREAGTQSLREAVQALRAGLEEHTRERVPRHWAAGQNDLGLALGALGRREGRRDLLEQAVQALRAALEERRRETAPLEWARSQVDLARALAALAELTADAPLRAQAAAAAAAALEVLVGDGPDRRAALVLAGAVS